MIEILQGTQITLGINLTDEDTGESITDADVTEVEVVIGHIRKTLSGGDIGYNGERAEWILPLTQEETFALYPKIYQPVVRVVLNNGAVPGARLDRVRIIENKNKEVL